MLYRKLKKNPLPSTNNSTDSTGEFTRTGVLRDELGVGWRVWLWLSQQFSATSMGTLGVVVASAAAYTTYLNGKVATHETHIAVLETKVLPTVQQMDEMRSDIRDLKEHVRNVERKEQRRYKQDEPTLGELPP